MARIALAADIAAPPDRVWAFFAPQRMPYWLGREMEASIEVSGGAASFAAGQKVRLAGRVGGRQTGLTAVVTRAEPQRALEWRFVDAFGVRGTLLWEISGDAAATRVTMTDDYDLPGRFARLADWLLTRHSVRRRDRLWLERLRHLAERA
jgi:uncharacterized protein YndB with AHSA1/START domain